MEGLDSRERVALQRELVIRRVGLSSESAVQAALAYSGRGGMCQDVARWYMC